MSEGNILLGLAEQYGNDSEVGDTPQSQHSQGQDLYQQIKQQYQNQNKQQQFLQQMNNNYIVDNKSNSNSSQENKTNIFNIDAETKLFQKKVLNNDTDKLSKEHNNKLNKDKYKQLLPQDILQMPKDAASGVNTRKTQDSVSKGIENIKAGRDFKMALKNDRKYKNPSFFQSITESLGIKQYGTCYSKEQFDLQDIEEQPKLPQIYLTMRRDLEEAQRKKLLEKKGELSQGKTSTILQTNTKVQQGNTYYQQQQQIIVTSNQQLYSKVGATQMGLDVQNYKNQAIEKSKQKAQEVKLQLVKKQQYQHGQQPAKRKSYDQVHRHQKKSKWER